MTEVTKDEFYGVVAFRGVLPSAGPERSVWRDQKTGEIIGYTYPGYLCRNVLGKYKKETTYFLEENDES